MKEMGDYKMSESGVVLFSESQHVSVIMPALNEELNILHAIDNTLKAFEDFGVQGEIIVINDGSTDKTEDIVNAVMQTKLNVRKVKHDLPEGIGASFWDGLDHSKENVVVMIPGDNETDPWEIFRYKDLLNHVDIVIPFVFNKGVRSLFRNMLSAVYRIIINTTFLVNFHYTNGTILYRKSMLKELNHRSKGFFFQTDILIRAVKKGYLFAEVPYRLGLRNEGVSKAVTFPSLVMVIKGYLRLVKDHYLTTGLKVTGDFSKDSLTARRRK